MAINEEMKKQIDAMSYREMLTAWRFLPAGHPMFQGDIGSYFVDLMEERQNKIPAGVHSALSKEIGWGN